MHPFTERPPLAEPASARLSAPSAGRQEVGTLLAESGVVPVDHSAAFVHFLRESKLVKSVGDGRELIEAIHRNLAIHDAVAIANPHPVGAVRVAKCLAERRLNFSEDFAVVTRDGGLWDEAGGLAHEEISPAHKRVFAYVALYLRKLSERRPCLA